MLVLKRGQFTVLGLIVLTHRQSVQGLAYQMEPFQLAHIAFLPAIPIR